MESKQAIEYDFDAEKVMGMTREEAISFLGDENAIIVNEGLRNGTLTYSEFERICQERFPIPQQAKLVRNVIFNQLSKTEGFNMFESNKEKQAQYAEIARFREKAENGELTEQDLKKLCDKVYGENSDLSKKIQSEFIAKGKVKQQADTHANIDRQSKPIERTDKVQEKKAWELEPDEKAKIQSESAEVARKHREQQDNQPQQTQVQQNQEQGDVLMTQGQVPQQPMMDMGGMEL